jgi:tetratricopeptide (TPR) repeat protein
LHALAVAHLLVGRPAEAIAVLESVSARGVADPDVLSDLAASYLARSEREGNSQDLPRALDTAERALAASPRHPEAHFNRALALEHLGLRQRAAQAWDEYLQIDESSDWASEVRERRARLASPGPRSLNLQRERDTWALVLMPAWADAHVQRDAAETQRAALAEQALGRIAENRADRLDEALLQHWRESRGAQRDALARGFVAYRDAFRLYEANRLPEAVPMFDDARTWLERARTPFSAWAAFHVGLADFYAGRHDASRDAFGLIVSNAEERGFLQLQARGLWMVGLVSVVQGEPAAAVPPYERALAAAEASRDPATVARIEALLAEALDSTGRRSEAWKHMARALAGLDDVDTPRRWQGIVLTAALACEDAGFQHAALTLHQAIGLAGGVQPADRAERMIHAVRLRAQLGDSAAATRDVAMAKREVDVVPDDGLKSRLLAELRMAEGEALLRDPAGGDATVAFDAAIALYRSSGNAFVAPEAHLGAARAHIQMGRLQPAEAHLRAALSGGSSPEGSNESERLALKERLRPIARELAAISAERDTSTAVAIWDEHLARLVDPDVPPSTKHRAGWVADRVAFIFLAREEGLLRFRVSERDIQMTNRPVGRNTLRRLGLGLRHALIGGAPLAASSPLAAELFDILLGDDFRDLPPNSLVVLVPDDVLEAVPFAALIDPRTGHRAVEAHPLIVAPSLRYAMRSSRFAFPGTALVVANPAITGEARRTYPNLRFAEAEGHEVAELWATRPLLGADATRDRILGDATSATLFHFAGHAVRARGTASALLLAGPGGDLLTLMDPTERRAFSQVRMAFLAACGSAVSAEADGSGVLGLTRPFLAAGVPTVVGTLWDVDDEASRALVIDFYRELRSGTSPGWALRAAQSRAIAASRGLSWAAFTVVGTG